MTQALSVGGWGVGGWQGTVSCNCFIICLQQYSPFNVAGKAMHHYILYLLFKVSTISKCSDFLWFPPKSLFPSLLLNSKPQSNVCNSILEILVQIPEKQLTLEANRARNISSQLCSFLTLAFHSKCHSIHEALRPLQPFSGSASYQSYSNSEIWHLLFPQNEILFWYFQDYLHYI